MSNDGYRNESIIKNAWPEWIPVEGGRFARHWHITLEEPLLAEQFVSAHGLSDPQLEVSVFPKSDPAEIVVVTTSSGNVFSDELFFFAAYRLFERIEARFGPIRTIQGQEKSRWRPFRP